MKQKLLFLLNGVLAVGGVLLAVGVAKHAAPPLELYELLLLALGVMSLLAGLDGARLHVEGLTRGLPALIAALCNTGAFFTGIGLVIAATIQSQIGAEPDMPRLAVMICGGAVFVWASSSNITKVCINWFTRDSRMAPVGFGNPAVTLQPSDCADGLAA